MMILLCFCAACNYKDCDFVQNLLGEGQGPVARAVNTGKGSCDVRHGQAQALSMSLNQVYRPDNFGLSKALLSRMTT